MPENLKDWPEDFHLDNGNYCCKCVKCGSEFVDYKRRVVCRECAANAVSTVADPAANVDITPDPAEGDG